MSKNDTYDFEVIVVENGSYDSTFEKLLKVNKEDNRFKILQLSRNFGWEGGITAGLRYAKGDAAVIIMADLQEPPEMVSQFLAKWEEGYDVVYGIVKKRPGIPWRRRIFTNIFYKIIYLLTNKLVPENVSDFRLVDRKVYMTINGMNERNRFLRGLFAWSGFKQVGISFERPPRKYGKSKADTITVLRAAFNAVFAFSYIPLRVATLIGFMLSIISFILMVFELVMYIIAGRDVPGFLSLILIMLFLFGMLFLILGIIGEYISRIYDEVKERPNYIVKKEIGL
jgi:dolichol-phosphate mannosyltransferase